MQHSRSVLARITAVAPALCLALACAATQAAGPRGGASKPKEAAPKVEPASKASPGAAASSEPDNAIAMGRLALVVTNESGSPMGRVNVDIASTSTRSYRERGITDGLGRITFGSVPERVNISVTASNGSFSQNYQVPQTGTTEVRITVQTFDTGEQAPDADGGGGGGGGGGRGGAGGGGGRGGR